MLPTSLPLETTNVVPMETPPHEQMLRFWLLLGSEVEDFVKHLLNTNNEGKEKPCAQCRASCLRDHRARGPYKKT